MSSAQSIDFTHNGIGLWMFWVIIPALVLLKSRREAVALEWRKLVSFVFRRLLIGGLLTVPVVGLLAAWQRQYFIRMEISGDNLVLGFRWPKPDLVIPLSDVTEVSAKRFRKLGHSIPRLRITTKSDFYLSFGYGNLDDAEWGVVDRLRDLVRAHVAGHNATELEAPP
jgi:hypothetical protein